MMIMCALRVVCLLNEVFYTVISQSAVKSLTKQNYKPCSCFSGLHNVQVLKSLSNPFDFVEPRFSRNEPCLVCASTGRSPGNSSQSSSPFAFTLNFPTSAFTPYSLQVNKLASVATVGVQSQAALAYIEALLKAQVTACAFYDMYGIDLLRLPIHTGLISFRDFNEMNCRERARLCYSAPLQSEGSALPASFRRR